MKDRIDRSENADSDRADRKSPERANSRRAAAAAAEAQKRNHSGRVGSGGMIADDAAQRGSQPTITDLLREGQEILVQIAKEPIAKKGARITSHIALPGRFLVYMPTIEHLGVSRKIESASERSRLRVFDSKNSQRRRCAVGRIYRPNGRSRHFRRRFAAGRALSRPHLARHEKDGGESEIARARASGFGYYSASFARPAFGRISRRFASIPKKNICASSNLSTAFSREWSSASNFTRATSRFSKHYGVQEEIDKALKPRVWLKSGGYLVINQTEALVAIDVNTGKFVGKGNARLEDTITKTNMEAVDEIARQIRLRDLGGILVLDLIDMEDRRNRNKVSQALQEALASDKSPTKVFVVQRFRFDYYDPQARQAIARKNDVRAVRLLRRRGLGEIAADGLLRNSGRSQTAFEKRGRCATDDFESSSGRGERSQKSEKSVLEEIEAYLGNVDITGDKTIHQNQFDFAFV